MKRSIRCTVAAAALLAAGPCVTAMAGECRRGQDRPSGVWSPACATSKGWINLGAIRQLSNVLLTDECPTVILHSKDIELKV